MEDRIRVRTDAEATPQEVRAVQEIVRDIGLDANVEATGEARPVAYTGEGNGTDWIVQVLLPTATVGAFLTAYFGAAGKSAWQKTEAWVKKLREARRSSPFRDGRVRINDGKDTELTIDLAPKPPPADAWRRLFELDWSELEGYRIYWEDYERRWVAIIRGDLPPSRRRSDPPPQTDPGTPRRGESRVEVCWGWETPEDQQDIREVFRSEGIEADPRVVTHPTGGEPGFIIEIIVAGAFVSFLHGYFEAAGADAWRSTKRLVEKVQAWFKKRYGSEPPWDRCTLILRDRQGRSTIFLTSTLPDKAYRELADLDLRPGRAYRWDESREAWLVSRGWLLGLLSLPWRRVRSMR